MTTPSFGEQYLGWPVPFLTARPARLTDLLIWVPGGYAAVNDLMLSRVSPAGYKVLSPAIFLASFAAIGALALAAPWRRRVRKAGTQPHGLARVG